MKRKFDTNRAHESHESFYMGGYDSTGAMIVGTGAVDLTSHYALVVPYPMTDGSHLQWEAVQMRMTQSNISKNSLWT